jgi:hypothetical protein
VRWLEGRDTVREYMVLRATLTTGEQFVLDFTSCQWGWEEYLYDWATFVKCRASSVIGIAPLGQWCNVTCKQRNIQPRGYDLGVVMLRKETMASIVADFEKLVEHPVKWPAIIDRTADRYAAFLAPILSLTNKLVQDLNAEDGKRHYGRVYFEGDGSWRHNVVTTGGSAKRLLDIWFTDEEAEEIMDNVDECKRLWNEKAQAYARKPRVYERPQRGARYR